MRIVGEIIYVVPEEREEFIRKNLNPSKEMQKAMWTLGIRNESFFMMQDYIIMTFRYNGDNFYEDITKLASVPGMSEVMVTKRRRDVPAEDRETTNWWAPLKKLGHILVEKPEEDDDLTWEKDYRSMLSGAMIHSENYTDLAYDEDDWSESVHI